MYVDLVFLLDLEAKVPHEIIDQHGGDVIETRVEGGGKAGIKWNKIHPGLRTCNKYPKMLKIIIGIECQ